MSETYNGWSNYATWRINLEIVDGYAWEDMKFEDITALCEYLKEMVDDAITNYGELEGLAVDYARAFAEDVNYAEIARHIIDDGLVNI